MYSDGQQRLQRVLAEMVAADPKAVRRGVSFITVHYTTWSLMGCPAGVVVLGGHVPIEPTGRDPDLVRWRYRRRKPRRAWKHGQEATKIH